MAVRAALAICVQDCVYFVETPSTQAFVIFEIVCASFKRSFVQLGRGNWNRQRNHSREV